MTSVLIPQRYTVFDIVKHIGNRLKEYGNISPDPIRIAKLSTTKISIYTEDKELCLIYIDGSLDVAISKGLAYFHKEEVDAIGNWLWSEYHRD